MVALPTPWVLDPAPCTLHHAPWTLDSAPWTLQPAPCILHLEVSKVHLLVGDRVADPVGDQVAHTTILNTRGGLAFKAHRLVYHSNLGSIVIKKQDLQAAEGDLLVGGRAANAVGDQVAHTTIPKTRFFLERASSYYIRSFLVSI